MESGDTADNGDPEFQKGMQNSKIYLPQVTKTGDH